MIATDNRGLAKSFSRSAGGENGNPYDVCLSGAYCTHFETPVEKHFLCRACRLFLSILSTAPIPPLSSKYFTNAFPSPVLWTSSAAVLPRADLWNISDTRLRGPIQVGESPEFTPSTMTNATRRPPKKIGDTNVSFKRIETRSVSMSRSGRDASRCVLVIKSVPTFIQASKVRISGKSPHCQHRNSMGKSISAKKARKAFFSVLSKLSPRTRLARRTEGEEGQRRTRR